jgi:DNA-binding Lrp family transcriptional regulator
VPGVPTRRSDAPPPSPPDPPVLDEVDRRLVTELAADGRMSVNELAVRSHVSRATAYARFDRLRQGGVIRGFTVDVDPDAVGLSLSALILVRVEQGKWRAIRHRLPTLPGVEWVALTSGEFDFVLLVRAHGIATLRDVLLERLHGMREVRSTETILILDEQRQPLDLVNLDF